jgi:hypothetical protein
LTKPRVEDFLSLVTRCERRLVNTSLFLSQAGKLQITNSVFTSPTNLLHVYLQSPCYNKRASGQIQETLSLEGIK